MSVPRDYGLYSIALKEVYKLLDEKLLLLPDHDDFYHKEAFRLHDKYTTDNGPAIIACAQTEDTIAIVSPAYLEENQLKVFEIFFKNERDFEDDEKEDPKKVIVFSERDYEILSSLLGNKPVDIELVRA